jgi:hypothetical protein
VQHLDKDGDDTEDDLMPMMMKKMLTVESIPERMIVK